MQNFKPALFAHSWGSKERQDRCRKGPALTIFTQREHCWLTVSGLFLGGLHCSWGPFHGTVSKAKGSPWTGVIVKAWGAKPGSGPLALPPCPPPESGDAGCRRCPRRFTSHALVNWLSDWACFSSPQVLENLRYNIELPYTKNYGLMITGKMWKMQWWMNYLKAILWDI